MLGDIEAATAEVMRAWERVRRDFPGDHPSNAERWLKQAFTNLNVHSHTSISADALCVEYARIR